MSTLTPESGALHASADNAEQIAAALRAAAKGRVFRFTVNDHPQDGVFNLTR